VGHVDVSVMVRAPLDVTWRVTNDLSGWDRERHRFLDTPGDGSRVNFHVMVPATAEVAARVYGVERCADAQRQLVYSRRWDNPPYRYSIAWWLYDEASGGTTVRCVQDFELEEDAELDDPEAARRMAASARSALERMARRVEAAAAGSPAAEGSP
jgi:aromatase